MTDFINKIQRYLEKHPIIFSIAFVIFALFICWLIWILKSLAELKNLEEQIRARGEPLTIFELKKYIHTIPVTEGENAANLYKQAFNELYEERSDDEIRKIIICGKADLIAGEDISDEILSASKNYLAKNNEALELLKNAAKLEKFRLITEPDYMYYFNHLRHLNEIRQCVRLLCLEAALKTVEGSHDEAIESWETIASICRHLYSEPYMDLFLVGLACEEMLLTSISTSYCSANFDPSQINKTAEIIAGLPELKPIINKALITNRAIIYNISFRDYKKYGIRYRDVFFEKPISEMLPDFFEKPLSVFFSISGLDLKNRIAFLKYYNQKIDLLEKDLSYRDAYNFDQKYGRLRMNPNGILILFDGFNSYFLFGKGSIFAIKRRLISLALAARNFEHRHQRLPHSLEELVPEFIQQVPLDIFDPSGGKIKIFKGKIELGEKENEIIEGEEKRKEKVKVKKEGIIIYSVGPDEIDNCGGVSPDKRNGSGRNSDISIILLPLYNGNQKDDE